MRATPRAPCSTTSGGALGTRVCSIGSACRTRCCRRCATARAISGRAEIEHFGATIPIRGVAGDQQAAAYGQACFRPGMLKATYGTGCFVLANTRRDESGVRLAHAFDDLPSARRASVPTRSEGAIFMAGATVQWLRDSLGVIALGRGERRASRDVADPELGRLSRSGLSGLGRALLGCGARAAIHGLTRAATKADHRGGRARGRRLSDPRSARRHEQGTWRRVGSRLRRRCGSMAA